MVRYVDASISSFGLCPDLAYECYGRQWECWDVNLAFKPVLPLK